MSTDEQQRRGGFVPDRRAGRHAAWHRPAREGHDGANPAPLHDAPTGEPAQARPVATARRLAAASIAPTTAAALAAGIEARVTAHSGRVGLASELTARGASTTEVMLAGNWKTARMVAHYSSGATAERGAVAKYL